MSSTSFVEERGGSEGRAGGAGQTRHPAGAAGLTASSGGLSHLVLIRCSDEFELSGGWGGSGEREGLQQRESEGGGISAHRSYVF